jgi:hypothetical protein
MCVCIFFSFLFIFCGAGDGTQSLMHKRQALPLSHIHSPDSGHVFEVDSIGLADELDGWMEAKKTKELKLNLLCVE